MVNLGVEGGFLGTRFGNIAQMEFFLLIAAENDICFGLLCGYEFLRAMSRGGNA